MTASALVKEIDIRRMRSQTDKEGYVYFISNGDCSAVKVGWATNTARRLASLQTGNHDPLSIVFAIKSVPHAERVIQAVLKPWRLSGEWYTFSAEIHDLIEELEFHQGTLVSLRDGMDKAEIIEAIEEGFNRKLEAHDILAVLKTWNAALCEVSA